MARIRSLKPESFESETLALVSVHAERTFHGMSTLADDRGRLADKPAAINGKLWAVRSEREPHPAKDLEDELQQLEAVGLICRYVGCDGKAYLHLVTWDDHQRIDKPGKPRTPRCPVHQVDDECGRHAAEPCPPPQPGRDSRESRENLRSPRETLAKGREDSRDLESGETVTNRANVDVGPCGEIAELGSEPTTAATVVVLADRLRDQEERQTSRDSQEPSREPREPSRLDLGPRTVDLGPRSSNERRSAPPAALDRKLIGNRLLDEHIAACSSRPPRKVLQRTGEQIDDLLDEDVTPDEIRAALALLRNRPKLGPGVLPNLVHQVRSEAANNQSPPNTPRAGRSGQNIHTEYDAGKELAKGFNS